MNHKLNTSKKGQTLLIVAVIAAGLVITAVIFIYSVINNIKGQKALSNSLCAYYAAEAGIEVGLGQIAGRIITLPSPILSGAVGNSISYSFAYGDDPDNPSQNYRIESTGNCNNTLRKLEIKVKKTPVNSIGNPGNYNFPFSWKEVAP